MENEEQGSAASVKAVEVGVAVAIFLFGALVVFDSYRIGARWGDDGPQAGYFPLYVGLLICLAGAVGPLDLAWASYVPGYRTPALSGTGLCFASFR